MAFNLISELRGCKILLNGKVWEMNITFKCLQLKLDKTKKSTRGNLWPFLEGCKILSVTIMHYVIHLFSVSYAYLSLGRSYFLVPGRD